MSQDVSVAWPLAVLEGKLVGAPLRAQCYPSTTTLPAGVWCEQIPAVVWRLSSQSPQREVRLRELRQLLTGRPGTWTHSRCTQGLAPFPPRPGCKYFVISGTQGLCDSHSAAVAQEEV